MDVKKPLGVSSCVTVIVKYIHPSALIRGSYPNSIHGHCLDKAQSLLLEIKVALREKTTWVDNCFEPDVGCELEGNRGEEKKPAQLDLNVLYSHCQNF